MQTVRIAVTPAGPGALGDPLFPGASGDVSVRITNPTSRPVTITGLRVPSQRHAALGFATPALAGPRPGCNSKSSGVIWQGAAPVGAALDRLSFPVVVAPHSSLVITLDDAAFMQPTSPSSCEGAYFAMPSPMGVTTSEISGFPSRGPMTIGLDPPCAAPTGPPPPPPPGPGPDGCPPKPGGPNPGGPPPG